MDAEKLGGIIVESVHDVFETLIYLLPEEEPPQETRETVLQADLIATIHISGDLNGIIAMACPWKLAEVLTRNMLGSDDPYVKKSDVTDCAGEIVNMVAGNVKTRCLESSATFFLSIPTVSYGIELSLTCHDDLQGIRVPFLVEEEKLTFQLLYKESVPAPV